MSQGHQDVMFSFSINSHSLQFSHFFGRETENIFVIQYQFHFSRSAACFAININKRSAKRGHDLLHHKISPDSSDGAGPQSFISRVWRKLIFSIKIQLYVRLHRPFMYTFTTNQRSNPLFLNLPCQACDYAFILYSIQSIFYILIPEMITFERIILSKDD